MSSRGHLARLPSAQDTLPPISQLDLHLTQRPPRQTNQWRDPFISPRVHASSSQRMDMRIDIPKANPSVVSTTQARPYNNRDNSRALTSGQNTSSTGKRTLFHDSYDAPVHSLPCSSNDSTPLGPLSSASTNFSTNQDDRNCESRDSGREDTNNEAEESIKRKRKIHALSEKDRRELANLHIRNLKSLSFLNCWEVTSRTPHNKEEAKNEILRHNEAFIMALMHRLAFESSSVAALEQEIGSLRQEKSALMQENRALRERCGLSSKAVTSHGDSRSSSNQPANYTASISGTGACLAEGHGDWSSMKYYHDCFKTRAHDRWLQSVIDSTREIAKKRNHALTKVVDAARSRRELLTKDLLDRSLD
ncbi:hypothetical protein MMC30_001662 [Trapelia coarctata]|nr:hypothetical protein [Trapelia coarctata]